MENRRNPGLLLIGAIAVLTGCVATPRAQLAASESMDVLAASLRQVIEEYGEETEAYDNERQRAVAEAFVERVLRDKEDETALSAHELEFHLAMKRINDDRMAARERSLAAMENLETLTEIAGGLRQLALQSINLDEEGRQYLAELAARAATQRSPGKTKEGENNEEH